MLLVAASFLSKNEVAAFGGGFTKSGTTSLYPTSGSSSTGRRSSTVVAPTTWAGASPRNDSEGEDEDNKTGKDDAAVAVSTGKTTTRTWGEFTAAVCDEVERRIETDPEGTAATNAESALVEEDPQWNSKTQTRFEVNKTTAPTTTTTAQTTTSSSSSSSSSRRSMLFSSAKMASLAVSTLSIFDTVGGASTTVANAATTTTTTRTKIQAAWKAVDGLNTYDETKDQKGNVVAFGDASYKAMIQDTSRTPLFYQQIETVLQASPSNTLTVMDLGTGPYAIFAIRAAEAGAKHVYAIEANPKAAAVAKQTVAKSGYEDIITVLEGYSTDLKELPGGEKCDVIIAEIIGSIASEEGCIPTILDASQRFAKAPFEKTTWIPQRIQTLGAPASYTLQNLFGPPEFDWSKLQGEPVRFNCRDEGLQLLSAPQIIEDIEFANIQEYSAQQQHTYTTQFVVDPQRIQANEVKLVPELKTNQLKTEEAERVALATATSLSGIAFWPRLILNDEKQTNVSVILSVMMHLLLLFLQENT